MQTIPTGSQPPPSPGREAVAPLLFAALEEVSLEEPGKRAVWPTLKERLEVRVEAGRQKYGTMLQTHNGRNALVDAWEETADQVFYLYQDWLETADKTVADLLKTATDMLFELTWLIAERSSKPKPQVMGAGCIDGGFGMVRP